VTSLAALLDGIARGEFPPTDMGVTHVAQPSARDAAVISTTAHVIVAADVAPQWLGEHLPPGDPGAAFNPPFLGALADVTGRRVNNIDVLLLASPRSGQPHVALTRIDDRTHSRVRRASRYRDDVAVYAAAGALVTVGRGLAGRWEVGLEVEPAYRGKGLGRALAAAATHLTPDGAPLWAQVAPGNAASLRAFLAADYVPVGQEALLVTHRDDDDLGRRSASGSTGADPVHRPA
jgi:GNAT superfamily N-acetyltransferase